MRFVQIPSRLPTLVAGLLLVAGCGSDAVGPGGAGKEPAAISVSPDQATLTALGDTVRLTATLYDERGQAFTSGAAITWTVRDTTVAVVDASGLVRARGNGSTLVSAVVGRKAGMATVEVRQEVASLSLGADSLELTVGDSLRLSVVARDANGEVVDDAEVAWSSSDTTVARVDGMGVVRGYWPGRAQIKAEAGAAEAMVEVEVTTSSILISGITPAVLVPGKEAEISGYGFSAQALQNRVEVDGVVATVLSASPTRLRIWLPYRDKFTCGPQRTVTVTVDVAGERGVARHELASAFRVSLAPGEESFISGSDVRCVELAEATGSYLLGVYNISTSASSSVNYELHGGSAQDAAGPATVVGAGAPGMRPSVASRQVFDAEEEARRREEELNLAHLERDLRLQAELGALRPPAAGVVARDVALSAAPPAVGTTITVRVPDPRSSSLCANYTEIQARVVYVGARAVVVEDAAAPLAGTMDSIFRLVGQDFEEKMLPVIQEYFGNPFALENQLPDGGRVLLVFTKLVNDSGYSGFMTSGDLRNRSTCASSSMAPTLYATVPTVAGTGYSANTPARWYRRVRATVIHETKHLARAAERIARGSSVTEETWLEESSARIAEELWGRLAYGYRQGENVGYQTALACEERSTERPGCGTDTPRAMRGTLAGVRDFYRSMSTLTPLGRAYSGDASFYNSGWLLVRWAIDHSGLSEKEFLKRLTTETRLTGVTHLETLTGRKFDKILGFWALSHYLDDYPGVQVRPEFTQPSWNLRDVFLGLHNELPSSYPLPYPLAPAELSFGSFVQKVSELRGGGAHLSLLRGTASGSQILQLKGAGGTAPSANLRIVVVRIQ